MVPLTNPTLTGPDGSLTVARPAASNRFPCQGDRVVAWIDDRKGLGEIIVDGVLTARSLQATFGPCGNVLATPGAARRELLSSEGVMLEDVFVLPRLPGALAQWRPPDGRAFSTSLSWLCPRGSDPTQTGSRLRLAPSTEGEPHTTFRVEPEPKSWSIEALGDAWEVRAEVAVPAGEVLSWMVGASPKQRLAEAAVNAPDRLAPQEAVQAGWLKELALEHLRTRTGLHEIDTGLEWAKARASGQDQASLPRLLAQLGVGLLREAQSTLDDLVQMSSSEFGIGLGEYLMWSGDYGAPARYGAHLEAWIAAGEGPDRLRLPTRPGTSEALSGHARLVEALEGLGYTTESDAVKMSAWAKPVVSSAEGPVRLPMAGGTNPDTHPRSDPESAWLRFRTLCAACSKGAISTLEDRGTDPSYALIQTLIDEVLHVSGEASLGRLRMAPSLPEHLTSFQVEGIRVGKGGIDFRVDREEDWYRYLFQPTSGAMPLNLTFEPELAGTGLSEARVDGEPADLDWGERPGTIIPQVQLPVDRERTVELRVRREEGC